MTREEFIQEAKEADDEQVQEWAAVPEDAQEGFCSNAECLNPQCQNPRVGICRCGECVYVVTQYISADGTIVDQINGRPIPKCTLGHLDLAALLEDFGPGAATALHVHSQATEYVVVEKLGPLSVVKDISEGLPN